MTPITPSLVLASSSPRRRELLTRAGYTFQVIPPGADTESGPGPGESAAALVERLAEQKAVAVADGLERALVVGCDTVAECRGRILGKPLDVVDARAMLEQLRGSEHRVYSGLCLIDLSRAKKWTDVAVTRLVMDTISDKQLQRYLRSRRWEGKAGAFGYQDGLDWIRVVQGSESNVVGLPMELFLSMLERAGYLPDDYKFSADENC